MQKMATNPAAESETWILMILNQLYYLTIARSARIFMAVAIIKCLDLAVEIQAIIEAIIKCPFIWEVFRDYFPLRNLQVQISAYLYLKFVPFSKIAINVN